MKRKIYISLVMLLCALFGFYIFMEASLVIYNYSGFYLFAFWPIAAVITVILGIIGGLFLGKAWWKFVYIDRCAGKFKKK
jgi:hypothetical protein